VSPNVDSPSYPERVEVRTAARISRSESLRGEPLLARIAWTFLRYEWLRSAEDTGCTDPRRGWLALNVAGLQGGELSRWPFREGGAKREGEFVFDHAWAATRKGSLAPVSPKAHRGGAFIQRRVHGC